MVIGRRDLIIAIALPGFILAWVGTFKGVAMFPYFESIGAPLFLGQLTALGSIPGALFGGLLVDRVRRRKPLFLLFFAWGAVEFLPLIFKTAAIVPIYLSATGFINGLIIVSAYSFLADVTEVYERGRVAGLVYSVFGLLAVVLTLVGSWSIDLYFALFGGIAVALGLVGLLFAEERISLEEWRRIPVRNVFGDRNFLLYVAVGVIMSFFWASNTLLVGNYAAGLLPDPRFTFWLVIRFLYIFLGFFFGLLVDKVGRKFVIILGVLFFATGSMVFVFHSELWTFLLAAVFFSIGYLCTYVPVSIVVPGDLAQKEARGRFYGTVWASLGVGSTLGGTVGLLLINSSAVVVMTFTVFVAFIIILPTTVTRETLPPKEIIEEMHDYIRKIKEKTKKEGRESQEG